MSKYYVYVHYRLSDNTPFYVGKGSGKRAWLQARRNPYWVATKNKYGLRVEIVFNNLSEEEAFQCERDTILEFKYFGYKLTNLSSGGEGASYKRTPETRQRMSKAFTGRKLSLETKRKIGQSRVYPKGLENTNADPNTYTFVRISDGLLFTGTRTELCNNFHLKVTLINGLFKAKKRKTACGWQLNERLP